MDKDDSVLQGSVVEDIAELFYSCPLLVNTAHHALTGTVNNTGKYMIVANKQIAQV